ncbi:DNA replication and repair protein RecF [Moraxella sp. Tifton1]|uniref:DNA replication/repair protein RecF n=1 Tax=Moraxella oculi TaxID=2940516 RepID=UPI0020112EC7|nr:DNA replication and repair protein RecF [Moraxella sp. Tifton1]MCL1623975.1 DNA replication and repair protein RecF [Moraxella sp. Tifton1]
MIHELRIHAFRNLSQVSLCPTRCNVIIGKNGSGKTSLLEAVFLLSRGKSFRHHEPRRYIQHRTQFCAVWARIDNHKTIAIQKQLGASGLANTLLKVNQSVVSGQSTLSFLLPMLLVDPTGMSVLEEGSANRRQLLDWLAFHVEPDFYPKWLSYQRLLKHRNALLKFNVLPTQELLAWDRELCECADVLHGCRQAIFDRWQGFFEEMIGKLIPSHQGRLSLNYQPGFDVQVGLFDTLRQRMVQDQDLGHTRIGAHRADLMVVFKNISDCGRGVREQAAHVLSRGEKKLLITALKLSQLQLICEHLSEVKPVVLIDDVDAELDGEAIEVLLGTVLALPCQLFITSLQESTAEWVRKKMAKFGQEDQLSLFRVEHGSVQKQDWA